MAGTGDTGSLTCGSCGRELTGRRRRWCSEFCQKAGARAARLAQVFNITPEEYDRILEFQGGVCAICGRPPKPGKRLAVDHDHRTQFVRGLLCFLCNKRVLGARTAEILVKTAEYVTNPPARQALGRDVVAPGRPPRKRGRRRARKKAA